MTVRIYRPAKTAMQSGEGRMQEWVLEFAPSSARQIDPLMGWTSSSDTRQQIRLTFATKEEAIAYATRNGLAYDLREPTPRTPLRKAYADNFKFGRRTNWTH